MTDSWRAYRALVAIWFAEARPILLGSLMLSFILPVVVTGGIHLLTNAANPARTALLVGGSGVLASLCVAFLTLPAFVGRARERGTIAYIAALPVSRVPCVAALTTIAVLLALPATLLVPILLARIVAMPIKFTPWMIIVAALVVLAFCGVGQIVGLLAHTEHTAMIAGIVLSIVLVAGPLFLPTLTGPLRWLGLFLPTGVAGDAAAAAVRHQMGSLPLDVVVLAIYAMIAFGLVDRALPWHPGDRRTFFAPRI